MNYHYGFFDAPAVPAYPNSTPAMKPAICVMKRYWNPIFLGILKVALNKQLFLY